MNRRKFPMLHTLAQLFIALTVGVLEKICIFLYCCLPIGIFMLMMSSRTKNHKATAIGTYTNERSEFQHIFPNYILVIVEPNLMKKAIEAKVNALNAFLNKYKFIIMFLFVLFIIGLLSAYYVLMYNK